ncbi:MAG: tetratricopeptide repeat protein [Planctomycetota bacterium]|nr:MAG: tetratricopeptide repeat protein [Planctomycetota bacterium]
MRTLLITLVAWLAYAAPLLAQVDGPDEATNPDEQQEDERLQLGQRVMLDRSPGGELSRGTLLTILAIDGERLRVCHLAPRWLDQDAVLDLAAAYEKLKQELADNPRDVELHVALGNVYRGQWLFDAAVESYCRALALDADHPGARRGRAEAYYFAVGSEYCLADLDPLLRDHPDDARALYFRGSVLACRDALDEAAASLDAAIKAAPEYVSAYVARAEVRWRSGDIEAAMADYDEALRLCAAATDAYVGRATYYMHRQDYAKARTDLLEALEINPRAHAAHHRLAQLVLRADDEDIGEVVNAVGHARMANRLTHGQWLEYARTLSAAYLAVGDHSRALHWKMHGLRLMLAHTNHYRDWQLQHHFRHGKPRGAGDLP